MYQKKYDYENSDYKVERKGNEKRYFIKVKNEFIEVSEDVFKVCRSSYDKIRYTYKTEVARSILYYEDIDLATFLFTPNENNLIDKIYINDLANKAISSINALPYKDRMIAQCLFINQMTIQETADYLGVSTTTVFKHKKKIQKKLQKVLKNG